jgi:hypothetical protein
MLVRSLGKVCLNLMNGSSGVCSEEMFSAAAVEKGRKAVGKMAEKANQDVLWRIHCANLGEKRGYWEKKWAEWMMSENLEDIFPNIESLDALPRGLGRAVRGTA